MAMKSLALILVLSGVAWAKDAYVVRGSTTPPTAGKFIVGRPNAEYGIQVLDLEQAYDLAAALNEARERRTRQNLDKSDWDVMQKGPCVECNLDTSTCRNLACTDK